MAKLTDAQREELEADYHTNKYSQRELAKKYNISVGTVSKITKEIVPKNEHLVNAQITLLKGKSEVSDKEMNAIMNTANDEARKQELVYGASEAILKRVKELSDKNSTFEKVNVGDGVQRFEPRELNSTDLKNMADTVDKTSITLGVNQRHANSQIQVNNTNAQQTNLSIDDFYEA